MVDHIEMRLKPRIPMLAVLFGALVTISGYVLWRDVPSLVGYASLALIPAVIVMTFVLWTARPEPQPTASLYWTFVLGATILILPAIGISIVLDAIGLPSYLVAGIGEEVAKLVVLAALARRWRHLHDPMTLCVYGLALGGGFAFTENILYFAAAPKFSDVLNMLIGRGLLTPFGHPLFTAITAAGLGAFLAAKRRNKSSLHFLAGGFLLSVCSHALFDAAAESRSLATLFGTVFGVVTLEFVLIDARSRRLNTISSNLRSHPGLLSEEDLLVLTDVDARERTRGALDRGSRASFDQWVGQWLYTGINIELDDSLGQKTAEAMTAYRAAWSNGVPRVDS